MMTGDWLDLLKALNAAGVRYLIVGAHAMAVHGVPRGTQDLDIWVEATPENAERSWRALLAFGAPLPSIGISLEDLHHPNTIIQIGLPPNRVDVLTSLSGVPTFESAWVDRIEHEIDGRPVSFLGREALIATKRAAGRRKDLADLEALGELPPDR